MKTITLITIGLITSLSGVFINIPSQALPKNNNLIAQSVSEDMIGIDEVVNKAFYENSDDIFGISTMGGQLNTWFGITDFPEGSYPENQIRRDGFLINTLHQDLWKQQTQSSPAMRTQDLNNPFCGSLQTNAQTVCLQ